VPSEWLKEKELQRRLKGIRAVVFYQRLDYEELFALQELQQAENAFELRRELPPSHPESLQPTTRLATSPATF